MSNTKELDFQCFKEVFKETLIREMVVDNTIFGAKRDGEEKNEKGKYVNEGGLALKANEDKPIIKFDYIFEALKASSSQKATNEALSGAENPLFDKYSDRKTKDYAKQSLPTSLCDLLIYIIHKLKEHKDLQEELRTFLYTDINEFLTKEIRKEPSFTLPAIPQTKEVTHGTFDWGSKLKHRLFENLESKLKLQGLVSKIDKEDYLNTLINRYESPKGFTLSPHDLKRYKMLK